MNLTRINRLGKEALWILTGQAAAVLGSLVLVRLITEYLEPVQYGQLALGLTIAGLVNQTLMGGLAAGIGRYYSIAAEKHDLAGYLRASNRLMRYATFAILVLAILLLPVLASLGYSQWMGLAAATLLFSVVSGYNAVFSSIQNAARQRAIVAFHGGLEAWLKILAASGALIWLGRSSTAVVLGYSLSLLLVTSSQLFFMRRTMPPQTSPYQIQENWSQQIWGYSLPFSIFGVFTWLQLASDRWALQAFASPHEIGLYAVVFQLGYTPISLATGMVMSFLGPILYQRSGIATDHARNISVHIIAWRVTSLGLFITALAFIFTTSQHEWLFRILVAKQYQEASFLLPWVILAGGIFACGQILALKLMSEMRPSSMTIAKIATASVGTGLNIVGAAYFGLRGVVAALVIFSCLYFCWMTLLALHPQDVNKKIKRT